MKPIHAPLHIEFPPQKSPVVTLPPERWIVRKRLLWQLLHVAHRETGSWRQGLQAVKALQAKYRSLFQEDLYQKTVKAGGRYFWRVFTPGFPSPASREVQADELRRLDPHSAHHYIRSVLVGITSRCPMRCEHCYEWQNLRQKETLSRDDLAAIVRKFQDYGTGQFIFGGGEPMVRLEDLCAVVKEARRDSEFWIYTSGFRLEKKEARQLKEAGLTGVMVSLDHYLPETHDRFRGFPGAYNHAISAALESKAAGLVTGLALCTTDAFTSEANIRHYLDLAKRLGVGFVQFLEPKAAGRYAGQDVRLHPEKQALLERLTHEYNQSPQWRSYPIINYPEALFRKAGCIAGDRTLYINTKGEPQLCPFCHHPTGKVLEMEIEEILQGLRSLACVDFQKSTF